MNEQLDFYFKVRECVIWDERYPKEGQVLAVVLRGRDVRHLLPHEMSLEWRDRQLVSPFDRYVVRVYRKGNPLRPCKPQIYTPIAGAVHKSGNLIIPPSP